ncbi:unnamed protein product [Notodromas monacha]|uniref:F-BAR domain only protein 2 n=1 Tax=Notodromas monacha TaxID=399045 RepID=A0A7R9BGJ8_9CRUS|nr:unnamed protein product [Notodromas monacha]CAG0914899.1 unnamed protein product [Notodromas monacha]
MSVVNELSKIEEASSSQLGKLVYKSNSGCNHGSFAPIWQALKLTIEKFASLHSQAVQKLHELIKEVAKYSEELHKKHKQVKDEQSGTQDVVQLIQVTNANLQKAVLNYQQKFAEVEKLKNENGASSKEVERAEAKSKKALDDYRALVQKYNGVRADFEKKMTNSCLQFQDLESNHLKLMREFITSYSDIVENNHSLIGQVHADFRQQCEELTVERLLEQFVQQKETGPEIPPAVTVEEVNPQRSNEPLVDVSWAPETASIGSNSVGGPSGDLLSSLSAPLASVDSSSAEQTPPKPSKKDEMKLLRARYVEDETNCPTNPGKLTDSRKKSAQESSDSASRGGQLAAKTSRRTASFLNLFNAVNASDKTSTAAAWTTSTAATTTSTSGGNGQSSSPQQSPESNHGTAMELIACFAPSFLCAIAVNDSNFRLGDIVKMVVSFPYFSLLVFVVVLGTGFLKSRRKKKEKEKKKEVELEIPKEEKLPSEDKSRSRIVENVQSNPERITPTIPENPEVDNEGYSVPPADFRMSALDHRRSSFSSSSGSGSGSDSDDDRRVVPMVEIKPLGPGVPYSSASVDELRAVMEGITLGGGVARASPVQSIGGSSTVRMDLNPRRLPNSPLTISLNPESNKTNNETGSSSEAKESSGTPTDLTTRKSQIAPTSPTSITSSSSGFVDLFKQWGDAPPLIPPKQGAANSDGQSSIAIPRPPRKTDLTATMLRSRITNSSSSLSRADSLGSLASFAAADFKYVGTSSGGPTPTLLTSSSRGPSPLTIGMFDTIPIAVAFQEMVHAYFRGADESRCLVKQIGDLVMSFPAGIVHALTNNPSPPPLVFSIKNTTKLNSILANKQLLALEPNQSTPTSPVYEFKMTALIDHLKKQAESFPNSYYFNVDILKYQIKSEPGAQSAPFQLVTYWKCESLHTDLRVDYKYNGKAALASPAALLNLAISVPVNGGVKSMHARPVGTWVEETSRAQWKFTELSSHSENGGCGELRARFELKSGPGSPGTVSCSFNCEGTTLSGAEFQLVGPGYRVSLIKKKLVSGKYTCDPEVYQLRSISATPGSNGGERYAAPPGEARYAAPPSGETRYAPPPVSAAASENRYAAPPGIPKEAKNSSSPSRNASAPTPV